MSRLPRQPPHDGPRDAPPVHTSLGMPFRVRSSDAGLAHEVETLYEACRAAPGEIPVLEIEIDRERAGFVVRCDGDVAVTGGDSSAALEWCAWKVNQTAIEHCRQALVLHAAAVMIDGRAVIITGPSGAGKSTLVAALTLRGAAYMGDDSLAADPGFARVRSNPKPVALDDHSQALLRALAPENAALHAGRQLFAPAAIGATVPAEQAIEPALIVQPVCCPGGSASVSELTPGRAAELLADQAHNFASLGAHGLRAVAELARRAPALTLEFDDLDEAEALIRRTTGTRRGRATTGHTRAGTASGRRGDLDFERIDGETLIWHGRRQELHRLSSTASAIWDASAASTDANEIASTVADRAAAAGQETLADIRRCIRELAELDLVPELRPADAGRSAP